MEKYPNDPFMNRERVKNRLKSEFERYGKLIIAYDFDYTVHSYKDEDYTYEFVSNLLREWRPYSHLIVFSASPESRFGYIKKYLDNKNIPYDTINSEIIERNYTRKVYYNVFLDDRAGLGETAEILYEILEEIKSGKLVHKPKVVDYSYFGDLTKYEQKVVDCLRKDKISDEEILKILKEL